MGLLRGLSGKGSACQCRRLRFDPWVGKIPLEEEMATHSSILAGKTSRIEKPGRLQSMGLQIDWENWTLVSAHVPTC